MPDSDTIELRVEELLDEWERLLADGEDISPEELCRDDPECLDAVRNAVSRLTKIDQFLGTDFDAKNAVSTVPATIGDCVILGEVARGGSAIVYRARQESLSRDVAVKLIRPSDRPEHAIKRFQRETLALSRLSSRFIASVFDAGIVDLGQGPQPFLVMEFVDGRPLDDFVQRSPGTLQDRLQLFLKICEGIHVAHNQGVIHRDIKPSNILVTSDGNPQICDFGIARILDATADGSTNETALTKSSEIVGTLQYMSPEHINGPHNQIDAQADVYSLGMVLFELVTGKKPYDTSQQTVFEAIETVRDTAAPLARTLDRTLPRDLETIVARAVEKDRSSRYENVEALASDLTSFLADQPIQARRVRWPELTWRWCRRNPAVAWSLFAVFVSLIAGHVVSTYFAIQARSNAADSRVNEVEAKRLAAQSQDRLGLLKVEMQKSETMRREAEANEIRSRRSAFNSHLGNVQKMLESDSQLAREWLDDPERCPPEWRGFSWNLLRNATNRSARQLAGHNSGTAAVQFSSDGMTLVSVGDDGAIRVWDGVSGELRSEWPSSGFHRRMAVSHDGKSVAGMTEHEQVKIIDLSDGHVISERSPKSAQVISIAWNHDDDGIFLGMRDGTIELWPLESDEPQKILVAGTTRVTWLKSTDRHAVASVTVSGEFRITRTTDEALLRDDTLFEATRLKWASLAPGGRILAVSAISDIVQSFQLPNALIRTVAPVRERIYGLACTPFPTRVLAACRRRIRIIDPFGGEVGTQRHEFHEVTAFDFSPKTSQVAISGDAGNIWLYEMGEKLPYTTTSDHKSSVTASVSFPKQNLFVTADQAGRAVLHGPQGGVVADISLPQIAPIRDVAISSDGLRLALAGANNVALVSIEDRGLSLDALLPTQATILDIQFSPDSTRIAGAGRDGTISVWDAETLKLARQFHTDSPVLSLQFRPDGSELYSGHRLGMIIAWNLKAGKRAAAWNAHAGKVIDLAITRDGKRLYSGGGDELICVWNLEDRSLVQTIAGHRAQVSCLALSPDGKTLASGGHDRQLLLWDAESGELRLRFPAAQGDWVSSLSFLADGNSLLSTGLNDIHTRIWQGPPESVQTSPAVPGR
jgi:eukaryotic-like serine/threonine-protein kinase